MLKIIFKIIYRYKAIKIKKRIWIFYYYSKVFTVLCEIISNFVEFLIYPNIKMTKNIYHNAHQYLEDTFMSISAQFLLTFLIENGICAAIANKLTHKHGIIN